MQLVQWSNDQPMRESGPSLMRRLADERSRARACGLDAAQLRQLRSLVEERGRNSWKCGDALLALFGPPGGGPHDGSSFRIRALADELGCSWSWLAAVRATSAAWPSRERRLTVAWSVHRSLSAYPNRFLLFDEFCAACQRDHVTPSLARLMAWLDEGRRPIDGLPGRPRVDPIARVERLALRLDHEHLALLIERLSRILATEAAAA